MGAIRSLAEDSMGQLWVGTHAGVYVLNPETGDVKHIGEDGDEPQGLASHLINSLALDRHGHMWIGTDKHGVYQYHPQRNEFTHYPSTSYDPFKFPPGAVTHIHEDNESNLWFTVGNYGVYRLSPSLEKFTVEQHSFDSANSLAFNNVLDLHEDREGMIWIGTDGGGLNRFNPVTREFHHYRHDPADPGSISSNTVLAIAEDSRGFIWLGTWGGGLDRLDPRTGAIKNFKRNPRVPPHRSLADNNIFRIEVDEQDRLLLSIWEVGLQDPCQSPWMNTAINYVDTLTLPYEQRDVTLHFSATNLISPSQNLYRYRLYGQDDEWTETDSRHRRVRYNNLEPGEYRFQILAANNEGVWSGQFRVVYQPIINISSGELNSYEVLLRWHHPERGLVAPDIFIPMAESLGLIFDIGLWVLEQACEQLQEWKETLNPPRLPGIAVNLSPIQLERMDLLEKFEDIFEATGADRRHIKFEITESALMKHTDTVDRVLESLRSRGIELAIDDFGTGYSSLSYLDKLPVQILKVDRSFVNGLAQPGGKSGGAHEIVRATISLAHNLQMRVVAEGIETEEQLQALKNYGCDYGQGYLIARPLTPEDATQFLVDHVNSGDVRGKLD